jgi:hypothetical protein
MPDTTKTIIFTSLAKYQSDFLIPLAKNLEDYGHKIAIVCFHEPSIASIKNSGLMVFNPYKMLKKLSIMPDLEDVGIDDISLAISHEKTVFSLRDSQMLIKKLRGFVGVMNEVCDQVKSQLGGKVILIQEFGGFISLIAAFYAARHYGIDNIFMEPSFFQGRIFFVKNSFAALKIKEERINQVSDEVHEYINNVKAKKTVVIPEKDSHHYRSPWKKIIDFHHFRRLGEKLADKYIYKYKEEFDHIANYVHSHFRMVLNRFRFSFLYRELSDQERFVYYPLHVPHDAALTIRSPEYLDQYALLDYLARIIPPDHTLVFKEHPALVGAVDYMRVKKLLRSYDNIKMINPATPNYDVMKKARMVITVNSKSGAEAMLLGKPIIVLGDAFYATSSLVTKAESLKELRSIMPQSLSVTEQIQDQEIKKYFQCVWDQSWPGEIYSRDPMQISIMASSLNQYITASL